MVKLSNDTHQQRHLSKLRYASLSITVKNVDSVRHCLEYGPVWNEMFSVMALFGIKC